MERYESESVMVWDRNILYLTEVQHCLHKPPPPPQEINKTERLRESAGLSFLAEAYTDIWLEKEVQCTSLLLCSDQMFKQGNETALSLLWHIQRCLIMYLKL